MFKAFKNHKSVQHTYANTHTHIFAYTTRTHAHQCMLTRTQAHTRLIFKISFCKSCKNMSVTKSFITTYLQLSSTVYLKKRII